MCHAFNNSESLGLNARFSDALVILSHLCCILSFGAPLIRRCIMLPLSQLNLHHVVVVRVGSVVRYDFHHS
jgi:hypothetical protein